MAVLASQAVNSNSRLDQAVAKATHWLDEEQNDAGFWAGMLESNACMEAEWLLAMHFVGVEHPRQRDLVNTILSEQRPDGSWEIYYDAPQGDINCTVECYAALKAIGMSADAKPLVDARNWILSHGGLSGVRVFTRYWLALIGEWPWERTPNLPPEVIANPRWFPFNIYNFASWARATLLPLAVLSARRAVKPLPAGRGLDELFPEGREKMNYRLPRRGHRLSWQRLFLLSDRMIHWYQKLGLTVGRETAIKACVEWIVRHQDEDGAWGGIQPPWIYSVMALFVENYHVNHPVMKRALAALDRHWSYERNGTLHIQASESPVWDTMLALLAMQDCARPFTSGMDRALDWLLGMQITDFVGDWGQKVKGVEPGGWPFERANMHYPDVDDTAVALMVLARLDETRRSTDRVGTAIERGKQWILGLQSRNGGWAAFDRDNDKLIITEIPFCDFGEALDPPSADVTGHVLEALGLLGLTREHPAVERAYRYLRAEQEADGSWVGRWGGNYIYGTAAVLPGLAAIGEDMSADYVRRAADWIEAHQNDDGGWGETCASYMDESLRGTGPSTASQTAWALLALLAANRDASEAAQRGVGHLVATQREDGTWDEPYYTGTGFPGYGFGARLDLRDTATRRRIAQGTELQRGFMINYNLYRHYFPLIALGRMRRARSSNGAKA
ncbi:MAG TPA: squalene--hopene cyclase [Gammaproteobacteria bacterium]